MNSQKIVDLLNLNVHENVNTKDSMVKNNVGAYRVNKLSLFTVEYNHY